MRIQQHPDQERGESAEASTGVLCFAKNKKSRDPDVKAFCPPNPQIIDDLRRSDTLDELKIFIRVSAMKIGLLVFGDSSSPSSTEREERILGRRWTWMKILLRSWDIDIGDRFYVASGIRNGERERSRERDRDGGGLVVYPAGSWVQVEEEKEKKKIGGGLRGEMEKKMGEEDGDEEEMEGG